MAIISMNLISLEYTCHHYMIMDITNVSSLSHLPVEPHCIISSLMEEIVNLFKCVPLFDEFRHCDSDALPR